MTCACYCDTKTDGDMCACCDTWLEHEAQADRQPQKGEKTTVSNEKIHARTNATNLEAIEKSTPGETPKTYIPHYHAIVSQRDGERWEHRFEDVDDAISMLHIALNQDATLSFARCCALAMMLRSVPHEVRQMEMTVYPVDGERIFISLSACSSKTCVWAAASHPEYLCNWCQGTGERQLDWYNSERCFACQGSGRAKDVPFEMRFPR